MTYIEMNIMHFYKKMEPYGVLKRRSLGEEPRKREEPRKSPEKKHSEENEPLPQLK